MPEVELILDPSKVQDKHYIEEHFGYVNEKTKNPTILLFNFDEETLEFLPEFVGHEVIHSLFLIDPILKRLLDSFDVYRYYEEVIVQTLCHNELDDYAKQIKEELL